MLYTVNYEKNNQSDKSDMEVFLLNFVLSVYNMIYNHYALKCAYIFLALTWSALICNIIHQWTYNTKISLLISTMAQIRNITNDVALSSKIFIHVCYITIILLFMFLYVLSYMDITSTIDRHNLYQLNESTDNYYYYMYHHM